MVPTVDHNANAIHGHKGHFVISSIRLGSDIPSQSNAPRVRLETNVCMSGVIGFRVERGEPRKGGERSTGCCVVCAHCTCLRTRAGTRVLIS